MTSPRLTDAIHELHIAVGLVKTAVHLVLELKPFHIRLCVKRLLQILVDNLNYKPPHFKMSTRTTL